MPILAPILILCSSKQKGSNKESIKFCATTEASSALFNSGNNIAKSSPPKRATVSDSRPKVKKRFAIDSNNSSPTL